MSRQYSLLFCILLSMSLLHFLAVPQKARAQEPATVEGAAALVPLPKSCGGGLPPGASVPACCLFGYVFIDGEAVSGAKVTVISSSGRVEDWTAEGPDSSLPYYRLSLSDAPLRVSPGETITIEVEYSSHQRTVSHVVLNGAQQVDVVLPRSSADDYVFERQIWRQSAPSTFNEPAGIFVDGTNTIYVADSNNARIQVFNGDGQFLFQWGLQGSEPGRFSRPVGIAINNQGIVYIADGSNSRVQKFTRTGVWLGGWGTFGNGNGQFNGISSVSLDTQGNVYVADTWNNRIQKFTSEGQWLLTLGQQGDGNSQLYAPQGLEVDSNGNIYVADWGNHRIVKFDRTGGWVRTWGTRGGGNGEFSYPSDITVDKDNNVYVADDFNYRIQKFNANGQWVASWGRPGSGIGEFDFPTAVAVDSGGNIYVSDAANNRIQKIDSGGQFIKMWGRTGQIPGKFDYPQSVTSDETGSIYTADRLMAIQKFNANGELISRWENDGGNTPLTRSQTVRADRSGNIFVSDAGSGRIHKFARDGTWLAVWGSPGQAIGQFSTPPYGLGITTDKDGNVYVADSGNHRIQKFTSNGTWLMAWGDFGSGNGQFHTPQGVAIDTSGNIYVADTDNNRIQKFNSSGVWLATWGGLGTGPGDFLNVAGISIDATGHVFTVDLWGNRVQKFTGTGQWLGSWGKTGGGPGQLDRAHGIHISSEGKLLIADSGNSRIQVWRPMKYIRPLATLVAVSARSVVQGQSITLHGIGSDSDETPQLAALEWFLDDSTTPFATGPTASLATAAIAPGRHTVRLLARDTEGDLSDPVSTTIDVAASDPPPTAKRWTFLLYLDGDAPNLAPYLNRTSPVGALNRLERAAPNAQVTIAALYDGPLPGGGDSFRYLIRPDGSFSQESRGEVNMGDPQTLVDFVRWGLAQAPADHTYLALADHATALDGIAWDLTSARTERLTPGEIRSALVAITEGGARPIDVLHFDGCLMGLLEPAYQVRGLARYLVASQNLGWSAFAYEQYRSLVKPETTPRTLAEGVATRYAQVVGGDGYPFTVAALDLSQVDMAARATDALAEELLRFALASSTNRTQLVQLRSQVQKLDSGADFFLQNEDEYLDLDHWAEIVGSGVSDSAVSAQATELRSSLRQLVVRTFAASGSLEAVVGVAGAGYDLRNARGVGIYYPPRPSVRTYQTYVQGELNLVTDTRWDEYLAAGLTALPFDPNEREPEPAEPLPWPVTPPPGFRVALPLIRR